MVKDKRKEGKAGVFESCEGRMKRHKGRKGRNNIERKRKKK